MEERERKVEGGLPYLGRSIAIIIIHINGTVNVLVRAEPSPVITNFTAVSAHDNGRFTIEGSYNIILLLTFAVGVFHLYCIVGDVGNVQIGIYSFLTVSKTEFDPVFLYNDYVKIDNRRSLLQWWLRCVR
jgi:hypothetical protein